MSSRSTQNIILIVLLVVLGGFAAYCVFADDRAHKKQLESHFDEQDVEIIAPAEMPLEQNVQYNDYDMIGGSNYTGDIPDDGRSGSGPALWGRSRHTSEY